MIVGNLKKLYERDEYLFRNDDWKPVDEKNGKASESDWLSYKGDIIQNKEKCDIILQKIVEMILTIEIPVYTGVQKIGDCKDLAFIVPGEKDNYEEYKSESIVIDYYFDDKNIAIKINNDDNSYYFSIDRYVKLGQRAITRIVFGTNGNKGYLGLVSYFNDSLLSEEVLKFLDKILNSDISKSIFLLKTKIEKSKIELSEKQKIQQDNDDKIKSEEKKKQELLEQEHREKARQKKEKEENKLANTILNNLTIKEK